MNRGIILYSLLRFVRWRLILIIIMYSGLFGVLAGTTGILKDAEAMQFARGLLFGPLLPMMIAYGSVMPQVANYQRAKDGEYLSLIFSRPISRTNYILSKWIASTIFVVCVMSLVVGVTLGFGTVCGNTHVWNVIDGYSIVDLICNAIGYSALAVCIASFPMQLGVFVFATILYMTFFISTTTGLVTFIGTPFWGADVFRIVLSGLQFLYSFFVAGMDSYHVVNSSQAPLLGVLSWLSNVVLYLAVSVALMSKREFFYAND